jgi:hypothetical protein
MGQGSMEIIPEIECHCRRYVSNGLSALTTLVLQSSHPSLPLSSEFVLQGTRWAVACLLELTPSGSLGRRRYVLASISLSDFLKCYEQSPPQLPVLWDMFETEEGEYSEGGLGQ